MTAVDLPPGVEFPGLAVGEFANRAGPRALARRVLVVVAVLGAASLIASARRIFSTTAELALAISLTSTCVALMGHAVRRARLTIGPEGVRWGYSSLGVRMSRERIRKAVVYRNAVAFVPRRGSLWYVSSSDWDGFAQIPTALDSAEIGFSRVDGPAPLRASLQSYGRALNAILVLDVGFAVLALLIALSA